MIPKDPTVYFETMELSLLYSKTHTLPMAFCCCCSFGQREGTNQDPSLCLLIGLRIHNLFCFSFTWPISIETRFRFVIGSTAAGVTPPIFGPLVSR